jgi:1-acyl-sn-glycerol-3-phosphate acyltransferase
MIIRFLKSIYGLYAGIFFALTTIIVVPLYACIFNFMDKVKGPVLAHKLSRLWAQTLFVFYLIPKKVKGREFIKKDETYVFVSNHRSFLDIPLYALSCSNTFKFLSKAELGKIPLFGYVIRNLYITVDRKDKRDKHKSIQAMQASLDAGVSVFLCPEGTRNTTSDPLLPFKDGAFRLAIETGRPLAVLTVSHTKRLLSPLRPIELRPGVVHAIWSEPIITKGMNLDQIEELKEKVRMLMIENLRADE